MKLWKGATFAFMLCGAALSTILIRNMTMIRQFKVNTKYSSSPSSRPSSTLESTSRTSLPSSSTSSAESRVLPQKMSGLHRRIRSTGNVNSILSEFSMMLKSFTEGELQHVVGTLLDRKRRKTQRLVKNQAHRTKRARRTPFCSVRQLEVTVTELDLGFESDETLMLRYCRGKCFQSRLNYDLIMEKMMKEGFKNRGRKDKVSISPCCRPTAFEKDTHILDKNNNYQKLVNISAKTCGCV